MGRGAEALQRSSVDQMASRVEGVVDRRLGGQEPLRGGHGFEPLLLPLVFSDRQVAVLGAVILLQPARPVQVAKTQLIKRPGVGF